MSKLIPLTVKDGAFPAKRLLAELVTVSQSQHGMGPAEMRTRIRMLDKIEGAVDTVTFDSDEYAILTTALNANPGPFRVAHKDILRLIDDVLEATNGATL
jgi:hypothetical protein